MHLAQCVHTSLPCQQMKTYSELITFDTFGDRFQYLKLTGFVGEETFGFDRWLNQSLYHSDLWKSVRNEVIIRDMGCDLGIEGLEIKGRIIVHHMNPVTKEDIIGHSELILDPEFLICTTINTHNAIHYGDDSILQPMIERRANDTSPWL